KIITLPHRLLLDGGIRQGTRSFEASSGVDEDGRSRGGGGPPRQRRWEVLRNRCDLQARGVGPLGGHPRRHQCDMRVPRNSLVSQHVGRRVRRDAGERASLRREGGGRIPLRSETRLTGLAFLSFSSLRKTITHISPETSSRPIDLRKAGAGD